VKVFSPGERPKNGRELGAPSASLARDDRTAGNVFPGLSYFKVNNAFT
jgi:hypothetical protein